MNLIFYPEVHQNPIRYGDYIPNNSFHGSAVLFWLPLLAPMKIFQWTPRIVQPAQLLGGMKKQIKVGREHMVPQDLPGPTPVMSVAEVDPEL